MNPLKVTMVVIRHLITRMNFSFGSKLISHLLLGIIYANKRHSTKREMTYNFHFLLLQFSFPLRLQW